MNPLADFTRQVMKEYGDHSIVHDPIPPERISTGIFNLDAATGGGVPLERFSLFVGEFSGGKSATTMRVAANAQKLDRVTREPLVKRDGFYYRPDGSEGEPMRVLLIDSENAFDANWGRALGLDTGEGLFALATVAFSEEAYNILRLAIEDDVFDVVILDSIATLSPKAEMEAAMEDQQMGKAAQVNNRGIRVASNAMGAIHQAGGRPPAVILVNQLREKVGITYGSPIVIPGGKAQQFYSSLTVEFRPGKAIQEGDMTVGRAAKWKVNKSRNNGQLVEGEFITYVRDYGPYKKGDTNEVTQVLEVAQRLELIDVKGSFYTFDGEKVQGKEKAATWLIKHPEYFADLRAATLEALSE